MKNEIQRTTEMYSLHPINYDQIIKSLDNTGKDLNSLIQDDLSEFDQDHYDGSHAVDLLIEKLKLNSSDSIADLCCGLGGTSRYIADKCGSKVIGFDVTEDRIIGAEKLTELVGLQKNVEFVSTDVLSLPIADNSFDVAIGQEAFLHISDKHSLFNECSRVLKQGGRLGFTDVMAVDKVQYSENIDFFESWSISNLLNKCKYKRTVEDAGFKIISVDDLSSFWADILKQRYEMYLELGGSTSKKFGTEVERKWTANYKYFVDLFQRNIFGGIRVIAEKM